MKEGYKNHDWTVDEVMMLDDHNDDNFRDDQYDSMMTLICSIMS